jgi:phage terminase small subunit
MNQKLTLKQELFVKEYLVDLNATQAAVRAGYSKRTANSSGPALLQQTSVSNAIALAIDERAKRLEVAQDRVIRELARIAFGDLRDSAAWSADGIVFKDSSELTDDAAAAISEISENITEKGGTLRIKRYDKVKALELLGRHLGMFIDRTELTGKDGTPLSLPNIKITLVRVEE